MYMKYMSESRLYAMDLMKCISTAVLDTTVNGTTEMRQSNEISTLYGDGEAPTLWAYDTVLACKRSEDFMQSYTFMQNFNSTGLLFIE